MQNQTTFYFVYILQSVPYPNRFYSGYSEDYKRRLREHNAGMIKYTSRYTPWRVKTLVSFIDKQKAIDFEKYLKSGSGRSFAKRRF